MKMLMRRSFSNILVKYRKLLQPKLYTIDGIINKSNHVKLFSSSNTTQSQ